eukprot:g7994.t1
MISADDSCFRETARELAREGYEVIFACRDRELAFKVKREFGELGNRVEVGPRLDLCSLRSIRAFVTEFGNRPISILINNAGANLPHGVTEEGVALTMQVNYVGAYLLTRLLIPNLRKSRTRPKVVNVASVLHRLGRISAANRFLHVFNDGDYPNSKLAIVMFTHELHRRFGSELDCVSVDPGGVNTKIFNTTIFAYPPFSWIIKTCFSSPEDAALTVMEAVHWECKENRSLFFARGSFTWFPVTKYYGHTPTLLGNCLHVVYSMVTLLYSMLDYPMRMTFGQQRAKPVDPVWCSWNEVECKTLWNETESLVQLENTPSEMTKTSEM